MACSIDVWVTGAGDPEEVREERLRRAAAERGLRLSKSLRRDPHAPDYGTYWLIDVKTNTPVAGGQWGLSMDDAETWLTSEHEETSA